MKIRNRILSIPVVGVVMSIVTIVSLVSLSSQSADELKEISVQHYPNVTGILTAKFELEAAENLLSQAVTTGDEDNLEAAMSEARDAQKQLRLIRGAVGVSDLSSDIDAYISRSKALFADMQSGNMGGDFSERVKKRSDLYESIVSDLEKSSKQVQSGIEKAIDSAQELNESAANRAVIFAVLSALVMLAISWKVTKDLVRGVGGAATRLGQFASGGGDLSARLERSTINEVGSLTNNFNTFMGNLSGSIQRVIDVSKPLHGSSQELAGNMSTCQKLSGAQSEKASLAKSSMLEMEQCVADITQNSTVAAGAASTVDELAINSMTLVQKSSEAQEELTVNINASSQSVAQLSARAQDVGAILDTISAIAEQTNLLALNAAIEAARAGEQGRGFAVVADEVRSLAGRTQDATTEIRNLVEDLGSTAGEAENAMQASVTKSTESLELAQKVFSALTDVQQNIQEITGMTQQIATATEEQGVVARHVVENMDVMLGLFEESETAIEDTAELSRKLSGFSSQLDEAIAAYHA